jgi:VanZ family protein
MSASPFPFPAEAPQSRSTLRRPLAMMKWVPVLFALALVCAESTRVMCGVNTQKVLTGIWVPLLGNWHFASLGPLNLILRKAGHVAGYGTLSLLFRRAWYGSLRLHRLVAHNQLMVVAAALSVLSTCAVASLDEWHQTFLPGRTGTIEDVLTDTTAALLFNLAFWMVRLHRRRILLPERLDQALAAKAAAQQERAYNRNLAA